LARKQSGALGPDRVLRGAAVPGGVDGDAAADLGDGLLRQRHEVEVVGHHQRIQQLVRSARVGVHDERGVRDRPAQQALARDADGVAAADRRPHLPT